jgi:hypothetical protein
MDADWAVEIGPGQPRIDATWDGFVDLRRFPDAVGRVPEAAQHPALREILLALNAENSAVFTTKCDTWPLESAEIDPYEFSADSEHTGAGFASYIDVVDRDAAAFTSFAFHERRARELTSRLQALQLQQCRVDIVVREAISEHEDSGYGLTVYAAGCGANHNAAYRTWETVLAAVADTIASVPGE